MPTGRLNKEYRVRAERSAGSVFGAATAWLKQNGEVVRFGTRAAAEQYVNNLRPFPRNVTYRVVSVPVREEYQ